MHSDGVHYWQHDRGQDQYACISLHEHPHKEEDKVQENNDYILVAGKGEYEGSSHFRSLFHSQNPSKEFSASHKKHYHTQVFYAYFKNMVDSLEVKVLIDKDTHQK